MSEKLQYIKNPPIVEAIIDIDCLLPAEYELAQIEKRARHKLSDNYPNFGKRWIEQHEVKINADDALIETVTKTLEAFQFLQEDKKQLVQLRKNGFSFNRLVPYSSLDDYLSEIKRTFTIFTDLTKPMEITGIRLRCVNRLLIPLINGEINLEDYLNYKMQPTGGSLKLVTFANQYGLIDPETSNFANVVLVPQKPEKNVLPLILDIEVGVSQKSDPLCWDWVELKLQSLRSLRNNIFESAVTESCLNLFR